MIAALDKVSVAMFGKSRSSAIIAQTCVTCEGPAERFRDQLSVKEHKISGMCQVCQDEVFNLDSEDDS